MPDDPTDEPIGDRLRRNDEQAWAIVLQEIMPTAERAIRRRFGPDIRIMSAEEDVESARRTIERRLKEDLLDFNDWDELECLLVFVAFRKRVDSLRKSMAADRHGLNYLANKEQIANGESFPEIEESLQRLKQSLRDETERIVFVGKLNRLNEATIAEQVEAETGKRMTKAMVGRTWKALRQRFRQQFLEDMSPTGG